MGRGERIDAGSTRSSPRPSPSARMRQSRGNKRSCRPTAKGKAARVGGGRKSYPCAIAGGVAGVAVGSGIGKLGTVCPEHVVKHVHPFFSTVHNQKRIFAQSDGAGSGRACVGCSWDRLSFCLQRAARALAARLVTVSPRSPSKLRVAQWRLAQTCAIATRNAREIGTGLSFSGYARNCFCSAGCWVRYVCTKRCGLAAKAARRSPISTRRVGFFPCEWQRACQSDRAVAGAIPPLRGCSNPPA